MLFPAGIRTRLLKDHFLVPGAMWSQLREGEEVVLTGRLANGWFRCLAKRDVSATTGLGLDFFTVSSHLLSDGELPPTNRMFVEDTYLNRLTAILSLW